MKKLLALGLMLGFCGSMAFAADAKAPAQKEFWLYKDKGAKENHYIPSGWMGDVGDIKMNDQATGNPYSGTTCIEFTYTGKKSQGQGWSGVFWQNPPNNWGSKKGGFDLTGMTKLTFWARGAKGGERIEEYKMGGIMGEFSDSDAAGIGPVILNKEWTQYSIDLKGKDVSYIIGGFCFATNVDVNPDGATFYLDEIKYE
jgi:hypothetical protein